MSAGPTKTPVAVAATTGGKKSGDKKAAADGKDPAELSEDDQRIKAEVELLTTRAMDPVDGLAITALNNLRDMLRTATGAVGSIPKPLKFARAHYATLKAHAAKLSPASAVYRPFHDVLSFISMTKDNPEEPHEPLLLKLKGSVDQVDLWGHEYLRFLAGQISEVYGAWSKDASKDMTGTMSLARQIIAYMVQHQDEAVACDLAIDVESPELVVEIVDTTFAARVVHYLTKTAVYLPAPEAAKLLELVFGMSVKHGFWSQAALLAISQGRPDALANVISRCTDPADRLQVALIAGRSRCFVPTTDDETIDDAVGNLKLSELYRFAARDLDCAAPKKAEEVLKEHLIDRALAPAVTTANAQNLALSTSFVSAFANAGYGTDKLLTSDTGGSRIHDVSDHRVISSTAALGLLHLWDHEQGLAAVDRFTYADDNNVKAGALLATGMLMSGLRSPFDPALGLLEGHVASGASREVRIAAVLGLGLSYAGTRKEEVLNALVPVLVDGDCQMELRAMTALALAFVFVGSGDENVINNITMTVSEMDSAALKEGYVRFFVLALGILCLRQRDATDQLLEAIKGMWPLQLQRYAEVLITGCAYAATGNVVVVQKLLSVIAEKEDTEVADAEKAKATGSPTGSPSTASTTTSNAAAPAAGAEAGATGSAAAAPKDAESEEGKPWPHKAVAVVSLGLVAMGEDLGVEMVKRPILHVLLSKEAPGTSGRRGVPLALAMLQASTPQLATVEALSKLSHDSDQPTAMAAILSMGLCAAGSNHARVGTLLRNLTGYYHRDKDGQVVGLVRIAQGLTCLGKGHLTISPLMYDKQVVSPTALAGLVLLGVLGLELPSTILGKYHYLLHCAVALSASPRMLLAVDPQMKPTTAQVRVGMPVETVTVVGKPKTVSGFQTHNVPVLLQHTDRAEVAPGKLAVHTGVIEGVVVVTPKAETGADEVPVDRS